MLNERLMRALFTEREVLSDRATLRRRASEVGLPEEAVVETLASDRYADAVRADERAAARYGISGVPFFLVDGQLAASGALSVEAMLQLLRRGWDARTRDAAMIDGAVRSGASERSGSQCVVAPHAAQKLALREGCVVSART